MWEWARSFHPEVAKQHNISSLPYAGVTVFRVLVSAHAVSWTLQWRLAKNIAFEYSRLPTHPACSVPQGKDVSLRMLQAGCDGRRLYSQATKNRTCSPDWVWDRGAAELFGNILLTCFGQIPRGHPWGFRRLLPKVYNAPTPQIK